ALDDRCTADAEHPLDDAELADGVLLPDELPVRCFQAVQHSLRAVNVDACPVHDGAAARTVVVAAAIPVGGGILEGPQSLSRLALEAIKAISIIDTVEEEKPTAADGRHSVTLA